MNTAVQASLRVCEALIALRELWSYTNEWHGSRDYYCRIRLPQMQADPEQCQGEQARAILRELRLVATPEEWRTLPAILFNLDDQIQCARRAAATKIQDNQPHPVDIPQSIDAIKKLLAGYHFAEAEAIYAQIRRRAPGFDYRHLLHQYLAQQVQSMIEQVQRLLATNQFAEADQLQAQLADFYPKPHYLIARAAAWQQYQDECQRRQAEVKQALVALLAEHKFVEADELHQRVQDIFPQSHYHDLRKRYWAVYQATQRRVAQSVELQALLEVARFVEADAHVTKHQQLSVAEYAKIKAPYLQRYFTTHFQTDLDPEQAAAIGLPAHSLLVTARAGSGKTRVLTCKAVYLMAVEGVTPAQMLLLAFNESAAKTIGRKMQDLLRLPTFDTASTFHALAHALVEPGDRLLGDNHGRKSPKRIVKEAIATLWENPMFVLLVNEFFAHELREQQSWSTNVDDEKLYETKRDLKDLSLRGEAVKSTGEKYIADFLYEHKIAYQYEYAHLWDDTPYRPDFTLFDDGQPKAIIEHWAIDETDPHATTPTHWNRSAAEYKAEIAAKRAYWQQRAIPLIETSVVELRSSRADFEKILQQRLEANGFVCQQRSIMDLKIKLTAEKHDRLTDLFLQFIKRAKRQGKPARVFAFADDPGVEPSRSEVFWQLAGQVYQVYENEMSEQQYLDFEDLMALAIDRIHQERGRCAIHLDSTPVKLNELRWVLVDEFQDLSASFYKLLDALRRYNPQVKIFGVGDDWQAINAFAGAELTYFQQFNQLFANAQHAQILTNYRSLPNIVESANKFMAGKGSPARTLPGKIGGYQKIDKIDTEMSFDAENCTDDRRFLFDDKQPSRNALAERTLKRCWQIISHESNRGKRIAILSRNNKIYGRDGSDYAKRLSELTSADVTVSTIHKFKGQEREVVILVEVVKGIFPLLHKDNQLWGIFIRSGESLEARAEAEEERLFYVALTRAQEKLWILTEAAHPSKFLKRLSA